MRTSHPASSARAKIAQHGVAAVEFALVAIPFFLLLFGAMEFGRLMYLWNTVQEVTRSAARQAVVTDFTDAAATLAIQRSAVFRVTGGTLPGSSEISDLSVNIKYLNAAGNVIGSGSRPISPADNIAACIDPSRTNSCIKFVEVSVCRVQGNNCNPVPFVPMTGLFSKSGPLNVNLTSLTIPLSTVRMPAESLGFKP